LQRANKTRTLIKDIRKRQSLFLGHIIWKEQILHTVITGKIYGKRVGDGRTTGEDSGWSGNWLGE
jgi:hypothetical protein